MRIEVEEHFEGQITIPSLQISLPTITHILVPTLIQHHEQDTLVATTASHTKSPPHIVINHKTPTEPTQLCEKEKTHIQTHISETNTSISQTQSNTTPSNESTSNNSIIHSYN